MVNTDQRRRKPFDVFLSYSRVDTALANRIVRALEGHGLTVWMDHRQIHDRRARTAEKMK